MNKTTFKRFQHWTSTGIQWSKWFIYDGPQIKYQLDKKLLNEYKEVECENPQEALDALNK